MNQPRLPTVLASLSLLASLVLVGACNTPEEEVDSGSADTAAATSEADARAEFEAAFQELVAEWDRSLNAGEVDAALALYSSDPVAMPPDQPAAIGTEAVRGVLEAIISQPGLQLENTMEDFRLDGDLAAVRGSYSLTTTPEGGEPVSVTGKWVAIAERQADGGWRTATNVWNLDTPAGE